MAGRAETLATASLGLLTLTILGAFAFEHIGGYAPCALCLEQREPYYIAIPALALALAALVSGRAGMGAILAVLSALAMLYGAGLGVYHSGVEWGWWPGPTACAAVAAPLGDVTNLLSALETTRIVPCDEVQWRFAGLTFANYNVVIALLSTALGVATALRAYGSSSVSQ